MGWLRHTCPVSLAVVAISPSVLLAHTLDFFRRQRSQALHTRLRTLSECEWSAIGVDWRAAIVVVYKENENENEKASEEAKEEVELRMIR